MSLTRLICVESRGQQHSNLRRRLLLTVAPIIAIDQICKALAVAKLEGTAGVSIIGDFLRLDVTRNSGAAFSFGAGQITWVFTLLAAAVIALIFASISRVFGRAQWWAATLLVAGSAGNLFDRLLRTPGFGQGHVVDFIHIRNFPIFNVADMCITAAACVLIALTVRPKARLTSPQAGAQRD